MEIICILLVVIITFFIVSMKNSHDIRSLYKKFLSGMWCRESDDTYLYIDSITKSNGFNNAYIVRSDNINEPLEVRIYIKNNCVELEFRGTEEIKRHVKPHIDMNKGIIIIADKDGTPLTLKKDN